MARIIPLKLNRNSRRQCSPRVEVPPTVAERLARLREEMKELEHLVAEQAAEKKLPLFLSVETKLKEKLDAVGRAATELFLTKAEERVAAACGDGIRCGNRILQPAPRP